MSLGIIQLDGYVNYILSKCFQLLKSFKVFKKKKIKVFSNSNATFGNGKQVSSK